MRTRLTASERTSQRIRELRERIGEGDGIGELMRLGIRELVEKALEEEVEDALGRGYYARGEAEPRGYRNGHRTGRIATAEGEVEFSVPQVRETAESRVRAELPKRTEALEDLAVGERPVLKLMYASLIRGSERWRGLKVGAVEVKQLGALQAEPDDTHRRRVAPATTRSDEVS